MALRYLDSFHDDQESILERTPIRPKKRDSLIGDVSRITSEKGNHLAVMTPQLDKTDCQDNLFEEEAPSSVLNLTIPRRLIKHFHQERAAFRVSVGGSTKRSGDMREIASPFTRSYGILSKEEQIQAEMQRTNSYIEQDMEEFEMLSSHQQESTSRNDESNKNELIENNPCFAVEEYQLDREPSEQELLGDLNFDTSLPQGMKSSRYNKIQHENNDSMVGPIFEVEHDETKLSPSKNPFISIHETD